MGTHNLQDYKKQIFQRQLKIPRKGKIVIFLFSKSRLFCHSVILRPSGFLGSRPYFSLTVFTVASLLIFLTKEVHLKIFLLNDTLINFLKRMLIKIISNKIENVSYCK